MGSIFSGDSIPQYRLTAPTHETRIPVFEQVLIATQVHEQCEELELQRGLDRLFLALPQRLGEVRVEPVVQEVVLAALVLVHRLDEAASLALSTRHAAQPRPQLQTAAENETLQETANVLARLDVVEV